MQQKFVMGAGGEKEPQPHCGNPNGIMASSPRLPSLRGYLGLRFGYEFNRNAVVANPAMATIQSHTYFSSHSISCRFNNARNSS